MDAKPEVDDAFVVYQHFLWFLGVWPLEETSTLKTLRLVVAIIAQATFMLHTGSEIFWNNGEVSAMVDVCLFFASAVLTLTKQAGVYLNRDKIAENLNAYRRDWINTNDPDYLEIMRRHVKIYKYQHIIYNSVAYAGTTLFMSRAVLINILAKRQLEPGEVYEYEFICTTSYFSREILDKYYPIILAIQYIQCVYCCTSGAVTDCFFFGLSFHLCAQLEVLKMEWQRLGENKLAALASRESQKAKVNELITRHKELVKLGENLEASFNGVVLLQLMISVILICMSGCSILVSVVKMDYMTMLISTNCISFMISESFIYGYASDYLLSQSESIVQAVYSGAWYELDNPVQKDILFVMMRAQIPLYITAGKFFYVTRNTILQLLKTSFSYLSVLRLTLQMSQEDALM